MKTLPSTSVEKAHHTPSLWDQARALGEQVASAFGIPTAAEKAAQRAQKTHEAIAALPKLFGFKSSPDLMVLDDDPRFLAGPSKELFKGYLKEFKATGEVWHLANRAPRDIQEQALKTIQQFDTKGAFTEHVDKRMRLYEARGVDLLKYCANWTELLTALTDRYAAAGKGSYQRIAPYPKTAGGKGTISPK